MKLISRISKFLQISRFVKEEAGMSFTETAILFPVLLSMMMAVYDLGQGVVVNQKTVAAAQVVGDLITRNEIVDMDIITDVVNAAELSLAPYPVNDTFGYDIASVEFDEDGDPEILWRVTENMGQEDDAINSTIGLGVEGEGVVVVNVVYTYEPYFSSFVVDEIRMSELAFLRGRKSLTVPCTDCP